MRAEASKVAADVREREKARQDVEWTLRGLIEAEAHGNNTERAREVAALRSPEKRRLGGAGKNFEEMASKVGWCKLKAPGSGSLN